MVNNDASFNLLLGVKNKAIIWQVLLSFQNRVISGRIDPKASWNSAVTTPRLWTKIRQDKLSAIETETFLFSSLNLCTEKETCPKICVSYKYLNFFSKVALFKQMIMIKVIGVFV